MKQLSDRIAALELAATPATELGVIQIPHGLSEIDQKDFVSSEVRRRQDGAQGGGFVVLPMKGGQARW